jgi:hypothetical protein
MAVSKKHVYTNERISTFVLPSFIQGKKYYLYAHTRNDNGEPFYFGIGTVDRGGYYYRATCGKKRNTIWKNIVAKTTYTVLIIDEADSKQEMLNKEINYIALMGKKKDKKGTLANITDGGEGMRGHKAFEWTDEMRTAASERLKEREVKNSTREKHRLNIYNRPWMVGRKGKQNPLAKTVLQIDTVSGEVINEFETIADAARSVGVSNQSLSSACNKGFKTKGFTWRFKNG